MKVVRRLSDLRDLRRDICALSESGMVVDCAAGGGETTQGGGEDASSGFRRSVTVCKDAGNPECSHSVGDSTLRNGSLS